MAKYKSIWTGQQIDDAVGKATKVTPNPEMVGTEDMLTTIGIDDVKYYLGGGGSGNVFTGYIGEATYEQITAAITGDKVILLTYKNASTEAQKNQVYAYCGKTNSNGYMFSAVFQDALDNGVKNEFIILTVDGDWTYSTISMLDSSSVVANPSAEATHSLQKITIQGINYKLQGAALAVDSYSALVTAFNTLAAKTYDVGQSIFVKTLNVPDLWIYSNNEATSVPYTYVSDEQFIADLIAASGALQIGYYKVSALEGEKIDLTNYVQKTDLASTTAVGVVKDGSYGVTVLSDGSLATIPAVNTDIDARNAASGLPYNYGPIVVKTLDYAVKAALCDGKGAAYSDTEKAAARTRIGAGIQYQVTIDI